MFNARVRRFFSLAFNWSESESREQFIKSQLWLGMYIGMFFVVGLILSSNQVLYDGAPVFVMAGLMAVASIPATIAAEVRRLRDSGTTAWLMVGMLFPVANLVVWGFLLFKRTDNSSLNSKWVSKMSEIGRAHV